MWQETPEGLYQKCEFRDFNEAFSFLRKVADVAESHNHHPRIVNEWNKVELWLRTHDEGGAITDKDWQVARAIDTLLMKNNREEDRKDVDIKSTNEVQKADPKAAASGRLPLEIKMFADGGSRGNPGPSASGFVLLDMHDQILVKDGLYLGITTNNQAEYQAVKLGLEAARKGGAQLVNVYLDSLLVVNQMRGIFKIRNRDLWPIHQAIKELTGSFKRVTFTHVPRELNKLADGMVNEILDAQ